MRADDEGTCLLNRQSVSTVKTMFSAQGQGTGRLLVPGFDGVTVSAVARIFGIRDASLYSRIKSVDDLRSRVAVFPWRSWPTGPHQHWLVVPAQMP